MVSTPTISSFTTMILVSTRSSPNNAYLTLPKIDESNIGRMFVIKDKDSYFHTSSLILSTSATDRFQYGMSTLKLTHDDESITIMAGPNDIWYKTMSQREEKIIVSTARIYKGIQLYQQLAPTDMIASDAYFGKFRPGVSSLLYAAYDKKSTLQLYFDGYPVIIESTFSTLVAPLVNFSTVAVRSTFIPHLNFEEISDFVRPYMCDIQVLGLTYNSNYMFKTYAPQVNFNSVTVKQEASIASAIFYELQAPNMTEIEIETLTPNSTNFNKFFSPMFEISSFNPKTNIGLYSSKNAYFNEYIGPQMNEVEYTNIERRLGGFNKFYSPQIDYSSMTVSSLTLSTAVFKEITTVKTLEYETFSLVPNFSFANKFHASTLQISDSQAYNIYGISSKTATFYQIIAPEMNEIQTISFTL